MGEGSLKAWGSKRRPQLTLTQVETRADELVDAGLVTREMRPDGRAVYRARERSPESPPVEVVTEPGWIPRVDATGSFFGVARSEPTPCAQCDRMAEALLSWERLWGVNGSDLAAMEARVQEANEERDRALRALAEQLQATTPPAHPVASTVYGAQLALDVLATTRGASRREVATRAGISLASAGKALAALATEGLAYESTPGLWRRR
jgi:hypothetical protein